jgi:hypothetical protein
VLAQRVLVGQLGVDERRRALGVPDEVHGRRLLGEHRRDGVPAALFGGAERRRRTSWGV